MQTILRMKLAVVSGGEVNKRGRACCCDRYFYCYHSTTDDHALREAYNRGRGKEVEGEGARSAGEIF